MENEGRHQKFGYVDESGIIRVPNRMTLKWSGDSYYFSDSEKIIIDYTVNLSVNMPIQGTAADVIKLAMIIISSEMKIQKMQS